MTFTYKTAKVVPVWTIVLKIRPTFVYQSITEHALTFSCGITFLSHWRLRYTTNGKEADAAMHAVLV